MGPRFPQHARATGLTRIDSRRLMWKWNIKGSFLKQAIVRFARSAIVQLALVSESSIIPELRGSIGPIPTISLKKIWGDYRRKTPPSTAPSSIISRNEKSLYANFLFSRDGVRGGWVVGEFHTLAIEPYPVASIERAVLVDQTSEIWWNKARRTIASSLQCSIQYITNTTKTKA